MVAVDDLDSDVSAFEALELFERRVVGADVDRLVGVTDPGGVVVEAEVAPGGEIDQVAVLGVRAGGTAVVQFPRKVADLLFSREILEGERERQHGQEVADSRVVRADRHVDRGRVRREPHYRAHDLGRLTVGVARA
jgi:hypothetical protein